MIDFIGLINKNINLTPKQKQAMLNDFCEAHGYNEEMGVSKKEFANREFIIFVKGTVDTIRKRKAQEAAMFEELVLEEM